LQDILDIRDKAGITVEAELRKVLSAEPRLSERPFGAKPAAFLEAHIEQGPVLELEKKTIGVVTGMQGKRTFRVQVDGEENHAGTSPRHARRDALVSAVDIVRALQEAIWDRADAVRFTIGMFTISPNAPSVVPGRVVFSIDLRHPEAKTLQRIGDTIPTICRQAAGRSNSRFRSAARSDRLQPIWASPGWIFHQAPAMIRAICTTYAPQG